MFLLIFSVVIASFASVLMGSVMADSRATRLQRTIAGVLAILIPLAVSGLTYVLFAA